MSPPSRRDVLGQLGVAVGSGFAGCTSDSPGSTETTERTAATAEQSATTGTTNAEPTGTTVEPTGTPSRCATSHDLPYAIPGAEETYQRGSVEIRNESDAERTVTLSIAHDDTTFFECQHTLESGESVSIENVTATAGEYTVVATVEDERSTTAEWHVPTAQNYPMLLVSIRGAGEPVIGCPGDRTVSLSLRNEAESDSTVSLSLRRDDRVVAEKSVQIDTDATVDVSLTVPIGDRYTLEATGDAGRERATIATCRGYETSNITVVVDSEAIEIDSITLVWE